MKISHKVFFVALAGGFGFWLLDSILDYYTFYKGSFLDLLILDVPDHEIYIRLSVLAMFLIAGSIIYGFLLKRLRAEKEMRSSEEKFRSLFNNTNDGIYLIELTEDQMPGRFLEVNRTTIDRLGYSLEELREMTVKDITTPEVFQGVPKLMQDMLTERGKGPTKTIFETTHVSRDGRRYPVEISIHLFTLQGRDVILAVSRDLSERKRSEIQIDHLNRVLKSIRNVDQLITREHDRQRLIQETTDLLIETRGYNGAWIAVMDDEMNLTEYCQSGLDDLFEPFIESLKTKEWTTCIRKALENPGEVSVKHPDDSCDCLLIGRAAERSVMTTQLRHADRSFGLMSVLLPDDFAIYDEEIELFREVAGDIAFALSDIDNRERRENAESALKDSEYFLKEAQRVAKIGHYVFEFGAGEWTSSETLDTIFGIDGNSLKDVDKWLEVVHPDDREMMASYLQNEVFARKAPFNKEYRIIDGTTGDEKWVHGSGELLLDDNGEIEKMIGTIQDITNRKKIEAEKTRLETLFHRSQRLETIGTLASGIAHDLNNLLTPILGYSDMARNNLPDSDPLKKDMDEVLKAANRGKDLVKQILLFSRELSQDKSPIDLGSIIEEVLTLVRSTIPSTIKIQTKNNGCRNVFADLSQIHQVLMNICTNAYQAMEESGGLLSVELGEFVIDEAAASLNPHLEPGEYARIVISDTGSGMDQIVTERIFEPFFTTKTIGKGTGLGLSVAHGIIRSHSGDIQCYSEKGVGSSFQIYLPVLSEDIEETTRDQEKIREGSEKIMVVDDEELNSNLLKRMLERYGYDVTIFNDSREAVHVLQRADHDFDLVISDLTMPDVTGLDLAREVQKTGKVIPLILITGYSNKITDEIRNKYDIKEVILKPIVTSELSVAIRKAMDE